MNPLMSISCITVAVFLHWICHCYQNDHGVPNLIVYSSAVKKLKNPNHAIAIINWSCVDK